MSRWAELKSGMFLETIQSMDECRHLCNEICCNDESDQCGEIVSSQYCEKCHHFTKEDGIIDDGTPYTE